MTPPDISILLTIGTVVVLFILFTQQVAYTEFLALGAVSFLLITGTLSTEAVLSVFSNPAAMTVASMFVLSAALEKTGVIEYIGKHTLALAAKSRVAGLGSIFLFVFVASFFINNTSIVLIMIPVVIALANTIKLSTSKLLIPLSYISILGGTCTLIGTSTNLLVDGVARTLGVEAFSMFEIMGPGLMLAAVGMAYMFLIGKRMLPERAPLEEFLGNDTARQYLAQITVREHSKFIGKTIRQGGFTPENGYEMVQLVRHDQALSKNPLTRLLASHAMPWALRKKIAATDFSSTSDMETVFRLGDRLVIMAGQRQVLQQKLKEEEALPRPVVVNVSEDPVITAEGIVAPASSFTGKQLGQLHLGDRYDVQVLGIHRHMGKISADFDEVVLVVGDTLLLRGKRSELQEIFENSELLNLSRPEHEPYSYKKAPIAIAAIVLAVGLAAFNVLPIAGSAFIGAVAVVLLRCLRGAEAYKALHGPVLLLIYAMLALSVAMENTGALAYIVNGTLEFARDLPPIVVISALYLFTSMLTEVFSNNAAAVMLTPIAIGLAQHMGVDPKAFAAAIMLGASASFATPIGYQTNTLVYNAGGYKFTDFVRVGLPMNILMWITASMVIPWYWSL